MRARLGPLVLSTPDETPFLLVRVYIISFMLFFYANPHS